MLTKGAFPMASSKRVMKAVYCLKKIKGSKSPHACILSGLIDGQGDSLCLFDAQKETVRPFFRSSTSIVDLAAKQKDSHLEIWFVNGLQNLHVMRVASDLTVLSDLEIYKLSLHHRRRYFGPDIREIFYKGEFTQQACLPRIEKALSTHLDYLFAKKNLKKPIWIILMKRHDNCFMRYHRKKLYLIEKLDDGGVLRVCNAVNARQHFRLSFELLPSEAVVYGLVSPDGQHLVLFIGRKQLQTSPVIKIAFVHLKTRKVAFSKTLPLLEDINFNPYGSTNDEFVKYYFQIGYFSILGQRRVLLACALNRRLKVLVLSHDSTHLVELAEHVAHSETEITSVSIIDQTVIQTSGRDGTIRQWKLNPAELPNDL